MSTSVMSTSSQSISCAVDAEMVDYLQIRPMLRLPATSVVPIADVFRIRGPCVRNDVLRVSRRHRMPRDVFSVL